MKYHQTLNRLTDLLDLMRSHREASPDFIVQTLKISRATLIRDIENLQSIGHNIQYCRKRQVYRLQE